MSVLHLLSATNFITVNRAVVKIIGVDAAVVLGELASEYLYWEGRGGLDDGYFYSTVENLEERTCLSSYEQRVALAKMQTAGWIDVRKKGMPAKRYIKIYEDKITEAINSKSLNYLTTSGEIFLQQDVKNFDTNNNITNKTIKKENSVTQKAPSAFIPPKFEEVAEYCKQRNNNVDAKRFFEYYEAGDWKDAKGNKVKNWKQKIITWEKQSGNYTGNSRSYKSSGWKTGAEAGIIYKELDEPDNKINSNDKELPADVLQMFDED